MVAGVSAARARDDTNIFRYRSSLGSLVVVTLAWVGFVWLTCGRVHAAELRWTAPAGCGDRAAVQAQVEDLIGAPLTTVEGVDFSASIELAGEQWLLRLWTQESPGDLTRSREIYGSCGELEDAAAVAIAMAITGGRPDTVPLGERPASAPQPSAAVPPPRAATSTEIGSTVRYSIALALALDLGVLPAFAPGGQLELGLRWPSLQIGLLGALFAQQRELLAGTARGGDFTLALGALVACGRRALPAALHLSGCAGFELGQLTASGVGPGVRSFDQTKLVYGPRGEVGLSWQVSNELVFFVRLGATMPLARDDFRLGDVTVHKPSQVSFRSQLGVEFTL
jgi:hypothetical protein